MVEFSAQVFHWDGMGWESWWLEIKKQQHLLSFTELRVEVKHRKG